MSSSPDGPAPASLSGTSSSSPASSPEGTTSPEGTASPEVSAYGAFVQVEVGSIQSFVFEASRLRDWRGASALLDQVEREVIPDLIREEPVDVIRSGGGVVVLGVTGSEATDSASGGTTSGETASGETARRIADRVAAAYRMSAPGAQVYTAIVERTEDLAEASITEVLARLSYAAAATQGAAPAADPNVALLDPMVRFCDSCGERPAMTHRQLGDTGELVCTTCEAKGEHGMDVRRGRAPASVISRFSSFVREHPPQEFSPPASSSEASSSEPSQSQGTASGAKAAWAAAGSVLDLIPEDLGAIAEVDSGGEIAVLLADGNRLGATIQALSSLEAYRTFARGIDEAVATAVFRALRDAAPPRRGPDGAWRLPWEVIFLGGDDVLIATAADAAVPVLLRLCEEIENATRPLFATLGLERDFLSMAAGIVTSRPHVPIGALQDLAGQLESSAKAKTYRLHEASGMEVHTVDLHRITSSGTTTLGVIRGTELRPSRHATGSPVALTMRPFTAGQLKAVYEQAQTWRDAGLPSSKVQYLREHLFESPAGATRAWTHVVGRASEETRPTWRSLMHLPVRPLETEAASEPSASEPSANGASANEPSADRHTDDGSASGAPSEQAASLQEEVTVELPSGLLEVRPPWRCPHPASPERRTHLLDVIDLMALLPHA